MNVGFMRIVDKLIGIPLCLFFSIIHKLNPFKGHGKSKPVKKILFLQISEMGSTISAYSSLIKAKELFPDAEISYFIFKEMQDSIHLLNIIPKERVFTVTSKSFIIFVKDMIKIVFVMRRQKFDAILDLELFSRLSSILSYVFGAGNRVGFNRYHMEGLYRGSFQTHKVIYNHMRHISYNFLSLIYSLREDPVELPMTKVKADEKDIKVPKIRSTSVEKDKIFKKLREINPGIDSGKKIIIINPNASELLPLRRWPMENYIALVKKIIEYPSVFAVVTGVESEIEDAEAICDAVQNDRCLNFAGKTTLRELIDLYNIGDILVSNDSGPPNFASLTDISVLVFFGPETHLCYKPLGKNIEALYSDFLCSPCVSAYNHRKTSCTNNRCLQAITVDKVYSRIKDIIQLR